MTTLDRVLLAFVALLFLKGLFRELVDRRPMLGAAVLLVALASIHPAASARILDALLPLLIVLLGFRIMLTPHLSRGND